MQDKADGFQEETDSNAVKDEEEITNIDEDSKENSVENEVEDGENKIEEVEN